MCTHLGLIYILNKEHLDIKCNSISFDALYLTVSPKWITVSAVVYLMHQWDHKDTISKHQQIWSHDIFNLYDILAATDQYHNAVHKLFQLLHKCSTAHNFSHRHFKQLIQVIHTLMVLVIWSLQSTERQETPTIQLDNGHIRIYENAK